LRTSPRYLESLYLRDRSTPKLLRLLVYLKSTAQFVRFDQVQFHINTVEDQANCPYFLFLTTTFLAMSPTTSSNVGRETQPKQATSPHAAKKCPDWLRRIHFRAPETGKTLIFLTNNTTLPATTICQLYKSF